MRKEQKKIFYVYLYMDPRKSGTFVYGEFQFDFEPFYVGKGMGRQWSSHLRVANSRTIQKSYRIKKIRKIQRLGFSPKIIKYKENISEQEALDLERELIKAIGRYGTGPLTNLTSGGEGLSGFVPSEETMQKYKRRIPWNKGRTGENDPRIARQAMTMIGERNPAKCPDVRMKISKAKKGQTKENCLGIAIFAEKRRGIKRGTKETHPGIARQAMKMMGERNPAKRPEVRAKISEKQKGNEYGAKKWDVIFSDGTRKTIKNLKRFINDTGFEKGIDFKINEIRRQTC